MLLGEPSVTWDMTKAFSKSTPPCNLSPQGPGKYCRQLWYKFYLNFFKTGDVIVEISGKDATSMTHKQAQEAIIACGNNVPLLVQRNVLQQPAQAWQPQVSLTLEFYL